MSSLLDLIVPFIIALLMACSGYMAAIASDWIKKIVIIFIIIMLLFDSGIIYVYYLFETTKIQIISGIMLGTILKVIIFLLYKKYLSNE